MEAMMVKKTTLGELAKTLSKAAEILMEMEKQILEAPATEVKAETKAEPKGKSKKEEAESSAPTIEQIRTLLAEKSQAGLTAKVKDLLHKFGAEKLSAVKTGDYEALYLAAKELK
ncbi:hypothetical protein [Butyrivibrio sp. MB2005]|uniref:hypothetical protein n=1 Tax=Butyrivibrio sp. MB2005 TaxID=1280678 RepID=UPI0004796597|nr:hypothetical protein [Butyrivibrio sp. MB2005]